MLMMEKVSLLKLNENVKYRDLPTEIQTHLTSPNTNREKFGMIFAILFILDICCLIPLIVNEIRPFTFATLPLILIVHIWSLIALFKRLDKYKNSHSFLIYSGCSFAVISYSFFIVSIKRAFFVYGLNWIFIAISLLTYCIVMIGFIRYYLIEFPNYKRKKTKSLSWTTNLLTIAPAAGYIIAQFLFRFSDSVIDTVMSMVALFGACLFCYVAVKFIHQYFFIKANQNIINKRLKKDSNRELDQSNKRNNS
ncbi:hypothetical protein M1D98_19595 [Bacillus sp. K7]